MCTSTRGSSNGQSARSASGPRFQSTISGTSSATTTSALAGSARNAAPRVKPMPSPPTSTRAFSSDTSRSHAPAASASSESCIRLLMSGVCPTRMTNSSSRRTSTSGVSSPGTVARPSSVQGIMRDNVTAGGVLGKRGRAAGCFGIHDPPRTSRSGPGVAAPRRTPGGLTSCVSATRPPSPSAPRAGATAGASALPASPPRRRS